MKFTSSKFYTFAFLAYALVGQAFEVNNLTTPVSITVANATISTNVTVPITITKSAIPSSFTSSATNAITVIDTNSTASLTNGSTEASA